MAECSKLPVLCLLMQMNSGQDLYPDEHPRASCCRQSASTLAAAATKGRSSPQPEYRYADLIFVQCRDPTILTVFFHPTNLKVLSFSLRFFFCFSCLRFCSLISFFTSEDTIMAALKLQAGVILAFSRSLSHPFALCF